MVCEELERLSKEELIELILKQAEQLAQLQAAFQQLQADYEALKLKFEQNKKPPTTSKNSSQPPSRDQKRSLPKDRRKRRHGPPFGHEKHERKFIAQADHVVDVQVQACHVCHADLSKEEQQLVKVNQITELPEAKAQVIEVRQYQVVCPECGQAETGEPPVGLEMGRVFGARLEATVVYYRQEQHMSYQRTQEALCALHGMEISQGGIDQIMRRTSQKAIPQAEKIQEKVSQSTVIQSDETSGRVNGSNWWQWVFLTPFAVLHILRFNRSVDVIQEVMGTKQAEVWVSDLLTSQLKAPAKRRQVCLAHQIRNLQAVIDRYPLAFWSSAMQALFRFAIHLQHQQDQLSEAYFLAQVQRIERLCDWLIQRQVPQLEAARLQRRYRKHRQSLFVFLYRSDVPPTNNACERALRPSVIHRKVIGCFRSDWGAKDYAALASVIDTAALSGLNAFQSIQCLTGQPALPLPAEG